MKREEVESKIKELQKQLEELPKFEKFKWYNCRTINGCHGFDGLGFYNPDENEKDCAGLLESDDNIKLTQVNGKTWRVDGKITEATDKEVEEALIKEAKRRGLKPLIIDVFLMVWYGMIMLGVLMNIARERTVY